MKLPRDLSGTDLVQKLLPLGFATARQSGSHIQVRHVSSGEMISVPAHRPLKVGTLSSILRDVQEVTGLSRDELLKRLQ
ncbi:MAG: type II toxin-antitoxin system HicA family toxin [Fimbriimonadales bacterium]